jgi:hypothetical protein
MKNINCSKPGYTSITNNISVTQVYRGSQFHWWRKPEYPEKTTDKLNIMLYRVRTPHDE